MAGTMALRGSEQRKLLVFSLVCAGLLGGTALAHLPLTYALVSVTGLFYAAGLLYEPLTGLAGAMLLGPFWAWLANQPSTIPAHIGQYTLLIFLALSFIKVILQRKTRFTFPPLFLPLLFFLCTALISLWNPINNWLGFTEFVKWAQMAVVFLIVFYRIAESKRQSIGVVVLVMLAGSGLLQACIGIWQFAFRAEGPETFAITERFYRAYGTFMQPNPYAGFVAMIALIMVGLCLTLILQYFRKREASIRSSNLSELWMVLLAASTGLLVVGLVASWSKGGWVGFAAALLVMLLLTPRKWKWGLCLALCLILTGWYLFSTGILPADLTNRLAGLVTYTQYSDIRSVGITDANFSTLERIAHWQAAIDMWRSNFWSGVGLGGYAAAYPAFGLPNWQLPLGHAHNIYLNMLAETGIIGFTAFILFFSVLFYKLIKASRSLTGWQRGTAVGLLGAWTHMAVHNLVDNIMVNNVHIHMGVMLALSAWLISKANETIGIME
jgi:O-antigen ligase